MKKNASLTRAHLLRGAFYLLLLLAVCVIPFALAQRTVSERTLTFAERIAYQRAIEDVYWRHRIWPRHRGEPDPKPSLDKIMSQKEIEKKVQDYLRNSQALEDYWQRPITTEQLQAEMDRMAHHTKQPDVLRELFAALNDDPFIVAECLARPVLAQRLLTELNNEDRVKLTTIAWLKRQLRSSVARVETQALVTTAALNANYTLPAISSPSAGCIDDTWTSTSVTNVPQARQYHTAVWTGSEMIIWGGRGQASESTSPGDTPVPTPTGTPPQLNTGARYDPATDTWTATSTSGAPVARDAHTAVWTGKEMIVWGGYTQNGYQNTGGRYDPTSDTWSGTNLTNAPTARWAHTAVWTGSEMIVWGGFDLPEINANSGGRYNPISDSWTATSMTNVPDGREKHTAVWTGSEMIVWGGTRNLGITQLNTGGRYNPSTNSWIATTVTNAPVPRFYHTGVWSGNEMIVWGGLDQNDFELHTGGKYNPGTDSWIATSVTNAPSSRALHTAIWTGNEMIVWGGSNLNSGGRYSSSTDSWTATSTINAPTPRAGHTAVWTSIEMIVWGATSDSTGGRYCAQSGSPTPTPTATPTATATPTSTTTPTSTATATATPTATSTATPTVTSTPNSTATSTPTATASATPTATATPTPTSTPRPTPTPRSQSTPRGRPTPPPRP